MNSPTWGCRQGNDRPYVGIGEALGRRCVADVSVLNNFVHSDSSHLLQRLLGGPVYLSPTVLHLDETLLPGFPHAECSSRFLKPLSMSRLPKYKSHRATAPLVQSFALSAGNLWQPVELDSRESALASRLGSREMRAGSRREAHPPGRRKTELAAAEAEVAAVAVNRGWALLTDDGAAVELLGRLYPDVPTHGTCDLLVHAARQGMIGCTEAADLFNRRIVDGLRFCAFRRSGGARERLWLRCDPARSSWEP